MGWVSDLWSRGHGFDCRAARGFMTTLSKLFTSFWPFVINQYNLVTVNWQWSSTDREVTVGSTSKGPCITDVWGPLTPMGSRPNEGRWALGCFKKIFCWNWSCIVVHFIPFGKVSYYANLFLFLKCSWTCSTAIKIPVRCKFSSIQCKFYRIFCDDLLNRKHGQKLF